MKRVVITANAVLMFTLEMAMLAALVFWGVHTGGSTLTKAVLAVLAPAAAVAVWAVFLAGAGHPVTLPKPLEIALKTAVFLVAALALAGAGRHALGVVFAVLALASVAIEYAVGSLQDA